MHWCQLSLWKAKPYCDNINPFENVQVHHFSCSHRRFNTKANTDISCSNWKQPCFGRPCFSTVARQRLVQLYSGLSRWTQMHLVQLRGSAGANGLCELNDNGAESFCERDKSLLYSKGFVFQQIRESKVSQSANKNCKILGHANL